MQIKAIKNEEDYQLALKNLEQVFDSPIHSEEGNLAEVLSILIEDWENKNYPIESSQFDWSIDYLFNSVQEACQLEKNITLSDKGLKLMEEVGELATEILKSKGSEHSNLDDNQIRNNLLLESCDVMIMIFSIMYQMGFSKQEIVEMTGSQINKWINQPK